MIGHSATRRRATVRAQRVLVGLAFAMAAPSPARAEELEYEVKAEFVERFTRFIEWPAASFGSPAATFVVCLAGQSPIAPHLEKLAKERAIKGRKATFRRVAQPKEVDGCHLVFIGPTEGGKLADYLAVTSGRPILTIGDSAGFAARGVLLNFYLQGGYVRFEVNAAETKKSGLQCSAKLLKLGKTVSLWGP
ncbi:MAG: YfiR family protein [Deltaproteobacteria bacterium]|nr:YfiR family protein [Deltaproteobacteria bacterium]